MACVAGEFPELAKEILDEVASYVEVAIKPQWFGAMRMSGSVA